LSLIAVINLIFKIILLFVELSLRYSFANDVAGRIWCPCDVLCAHWS